MADPIVEAAIAHLDFATPCNACGKPATLLVTLSGLPCLCREQHYVLCQPCHETGLREAIRFPDRRRTCKTCRYAPVYVTRDMISWSPLGGAR